MSISVRVYEYLGDFDDEVDSDDEGLPDLEPTKADNIVESKDTKEDEEKKE